ERIVRTIETDPVLSARLLRLSNSAYYHVSRSIGTVGEAVTMLGFVTVRTLVISSGLTGGYNSLPGMDLPRFWRYSVQAAGAARWLAKASQHNSDLCFTVALMHGIGQLIMHAGMPEQMLQLDKVADPLSPQRLDMERSAFGYSFAQVSAELVRQWRFPVDFSEAIHHFPAPLAHGQCRAVACVLHLAAWRARGAGQGMDLDALQADLPIDVCMALGLNPATLLDNMPPMEELCEGLEALVC